MAHKKGMVLESGMDWAIILQANGEYKKIKTNEYLEVGEIYHVKTKSQAKYLIAALLFITIILSTIDYFSVQAYAQVASFKLGVNRWGRVVSVQATDYEGEKVLNQVKVKNDKLESAVEKIYGQAWDVDKDIKKSPAISVDAVHKNNNLEQNLLRKVDKGLQRALEEKNKKDKINPNKTVPGSGTSSTNENKKENNGNTDMSGNNLKKLNKPNQDSNESNKSNKSGILETQEGTNNTDSNSQHLKNTPTLNQKEDNSQEHKADKDSKGKPNKDVGNSSK